MREKELNHLAKVLENPTLKKINFKHDNSDKKSEMAKEKFIEKYMSSYKKELEHYYIKA